MSLKRSENVPLRDLPVDIRVVPRHHRPIDTAMNTERVVRVANYFLLGIGYQVHSYDRDARRFRLSLWGVVNFIVITLLYLFCFGHHFETSAFLKLLNDASPFLRSLVRMQLMMGLKVFLFDLYELRQVVRGANGLAEALPRTYAKRFSRQEAKAYFLLFSTLFIALCIILYVAYEMHFKLPPLDRILVFMALFLPHFIVAGALRFYTVGLWVLRDHLLSLSRDIESLFALEEKTAKGDKAQVEIGATNTVLAAEEAKLVELQNMHVHLGLLSAKQKVFSKGLRRQLLLLLVMNTNCLLAGVYTRVYYETTWYVLFDDRLKHIFLALNYGIFVLIFWDYLCLCATQAAFTRVKTNLYKKLGATIKQRQNMSKAIRASLKDLKLLLQTEFKFKLLGSLKLNFCVFLLIQVLIAQLIAIVVVYQYLKDQIAAANGRLDDVESDS